MEKIRKYGLPLLTDYGWEIVGKLLMIIGLIGLAATQLGAVWP